MSWRAESAASEVVERVSVVVPVHDRPHLLLRAVDSLLAQEGRTPEVVVVDDSAEGLAASLVEALRERGVRVVRSSFRHACGSRNLGAREAAGDWLAFLDHDDWVEPGWLAALLAAGDAPGAALTFCGAVYRDVSGTAVSTMLPARLGPAYGGQTALFLAGAFLVRRELFRSAGGYDEDLPASQQSELGMRLSAALAERGWSSGFTREVLVNLESRPKGERKLRRDAAVLGACERILARHAPALAGDRVAHASLHRTAARSAARLGRFASALGHWWRAARVEPLHRSNVTFVAYLASLGLRRLRRRPGEGSADG